MDWLRSSARRFPDAPALICGERILSYAGLDDAADGLAAALAARGAGPGDRVAVRAEGNPAAVAAIWGIPRAGATAVLLNDRVPEAEARALTRGARARGLPSWRRRPHDPGGQGDGPAAGGPPHPGARFVVFTSGTSGPARGVVLTGENLAAAVAASQARLGNGPGDRWLGVLPLHHVGGLSILWRSAREGGTVVLEERFEAGRAARLLASGEIAFASLVPTMLRRVLEDHPGPFPGVRAVLVGGGPADPELLARGRAAGLPVVQTYGMTETCSQVATEDPAEAGARPGSAGRPLLGFEVRVVGDAGQRQPPGAEGRLEVRGPAVSPGYLDGPLLPPDGWFRTGDLGRLDGDGYLYVAGRADEVIVTGGENVHPAEVEAVLRGLPGVADARVFGEEDPQWGWRVAAEVAPAPGTTLDPETLAARVRGRLAGFKVPRRWVVVEEIRRTDLGKRPRHGSG